MILSIGELIDKLTIENNKIFMLREELHSANLSDEEYVEINNKMNILNHNRSTLSKILDEKVDNVVDKKEPNCILKNIKIYGTSKK